MIVAVTYEDGLIFQHFGRTENFKLYDVEGGKVVSSKVVDTNGSGHGALVGFLKENNVEVLICGDIGRGAQMALTEAGIKFCCRMGGNADMAVELLIRQELKYDFV